MVLAGHLDEEDPLQRLSEAVTTAEQGELLRGVQVPPQHAGFLQFLQLLPGPATRVRPVSTEPVLSSWGYAAVASFGAASADA